ncbi:MAG: DUF1553 domain-containing protein [Bacteroidota bacterium]|nr:DUF1553 domain-containing protein [Bacteroidota bacterium]
MSNTILKNLLIVVFGFALFSCNKTVVSEAQIEALLEAKKDSLPEVVDYNIHIRPLMSDNCLVCHGPDKNKREAGLAMHTAEEAFKKVNGNYALVAGKPHQSEAIARILSNDPDKIMPLPSSNLKMTDLQKALFIKWVKQGAVFKPHWAFIPPQKYSVPKPVTSGWVKNEIDAFVLEKLEKSGLKPSKEADKVKLARRVAFDLTGLPPNKNLLNKYLNDSSPKAYENLVDALLNSPSYGERMANEWCDVARYADSHGFQDDGDSEMWPWRDWAIRAFNKNMPYNQFITEQMAGDLLPNATRDQILATGFHRNHMINAEGGIIDEEFRTEYVLDRVVTTGKAFLALTIECSRCHDHKYDPISQKEFYQFSSFFNQLDEQGKGNLYENSTGPTMLLMDDLVEKKLIASRKNQEIQQNKLNDIISKLSIPNPDQQLLAKPNDSLLNKYLVGYFGFEPKSYKDSTIYGINNDSIGKLSASTAYTTGYKGKGLSIIGDDRVTIKEMIHNFERSDPFSVSMWVYVPDNVAKGYTLLANCASTYNGFRGYELLCIGGKIQVRISNSWPSNAISVITNDSITPKKWQHVAFTYDGSSKSKGISVYLNGNKTETKTVVDNLYRSIRTFTLEQDRKEFMYYSNLQKKRPLTQKETKILRQLSFKAWYSKTHYFVPGGRSDQGVQPLYNGKLDEIKIYNIDLTPIEIYADYASISLKDALQKKQWQKEDLNMLYARNLSAEYTHTFSKLQSFREEENNIILPLREIKVMKDRPEKRETYVLERGVYDAPKEKVEEGAINAILPFDNKLPKNRLGLASWLTDTKNPLVSRVTVNRYWQLMFGNGLVYSSGDFGNQGSNPSHPELLDWLSIWFVEHNWDVKALLKMMAMSATYRQSSDVNMDNFQKDPQNILLSRANRYRMPYEMVRDLALTSSQLLYQQIGGPSFKPYQPDGLWEEKTESPVNNYYEADQAPEIYRRSMYIYIKRTSPHPSFNAFDGPERFSCQVKRQITNTPLQALTTLNDPQFMECARVLAQRVVTSKSNSPIDEVFESILQRKPSEMERKILLKQFEDFKSKITSHKAEKIIKAGVYPFPNNIDKKTVAALALVAHTVYNLDETLTRE